ncbi:MAG: hypothetical protein IT581_06980 [Verrucomicrobiales bacterium]|nr:hypothetical protein [Verrucomicrobiales bacterium]
MPAPVHLVGLRILLALVTLLSWPASASSSVIRTWEDLGAGDLVDSDKPSGTHFVEGAEVRESANVGACSGVRFLAKRFSGKNGDPGPLTLLFDSPKSYVSMCVGNPDGALPRTITLVGYSAADAVKPVASAQITLPAGTPLGHALALCRLLDHDLVRVELVYGNDGLEVLDDLRVDSVDEVVNRIHFEEHPAGTLVESQYGGVAFPTRPEIVASKALGVGTRSESQALRQRIAGETDPGPMILDFTPAQGAVRVRTGYPLGEQQNGSLRVLMRALAQGPKGLVEVASDEVELFSPQSIDRALEVCRIENDIARVEIQFDSSFGGHEVIDDLEFGPLAVQVIEDSEAPVIRMTSPADNTVIPQPSSRAEHRTTTVTLRGSIFEDRALNSFRVQVFDELGNLRFDDGERLGVVTGSAPSFGFETPVLLEYGASTVRLTAVDAAGHVTTLDHHLSYLGPPSVALVGAFPTMGYPAIIFREASATGPAISNAPPVVRLTGDNFHSEVRFYLVPESRATLPPSAPDLIEATVVGRSADADWVDLRVPEVVFQHPGVYAWLAWDLWSRPGMTVWSRGGDFEAREWPYAALWSMGFRNRDETNELGDFEGVYGEDVLPGFLEPSTPVGSCDRGVNALNFFDGRYLPWLNSPGAGGSCFGFAAASQLFASGAWGPATIDTAVRYPTGFRSVEPMRFNMTGCDPQVPANLWASIQTLFGIHTSYEFLDAWNDQVETVDGGAMVGNPVGVAEAIRDLPAGYVLGFTPAGSNTGHAVAPYRVEDRDENTLRIWVLDSNFPYDPTQAEGALQNLMAVNRFIDVDRRSNTFRFSPGASNDSLAEFQSTNVWVGSALAAIPLAIFQSPRTIPMMDYLAEQYFGVTGDVEAELEVKGVGSWGWDERGSFHGNLTGLRVVPSFSDGDPALGNPLVLIPTNHPQATVSLGGKDPAHHLVVGNGGLIFGADRKDRATSTKDLYELRFEAGRPAALRFTPGSAAQRWIPELGWVGHGDGELLYRIHGLKLAAGQVVELEALPDERGLRVRNDSKTPAAFGVELAAGSVKSADERRWFGPFQLPAGAALDLVPSRWPAIDGIEARLDEDQNGTPESAAVSPGLLIDLKPGDDGDCNRNGILDALDVAVGTSADANGNGIPDECTTADSGGGGGGTGGTGGTTDCSIKGEQMQSFAALPNGALPSDGFGLLRVTSPAVIRNGLLVAAPPAEIGGADPGTLGLQFDCPRGLVALEVVNTAKSASLRARAWAYTALDSTKPVGQAEAIVPANAAGGVVLTLCRPLEEDIARVVLEFEGATPEALRSVLHATRADRQVRRYDFEDRAAGTVVFAQYPGVTFPDRPLVTLAAALGVPAGSGVQVLRKTPSDSDPGPLVLRFNPPQAEVRVSVGYPASESDGRPLRVTLRAFDGTKGGVTPIATNEVVMTSPRAINRVLSVMRCAADIQEVQVQFVDRPSGGLEAIDNLEFGPVPIPTVEPDTTAPTLRIVSPASGTVLTQLDPSNPTGATNLVVEITEARALDHVFVVIRDSTGAIYRRLDDTEVRLTGTAPRYTLQATVPLAYGTNWVEVRAVDTSANEGGVAPTDWWIVYRGPGPLSLASSSPSVLYPEDLVRDALPSRPRDYPEVHLPRTVATLRGTNFNRLVRVYAVAEDQAQVPPRVGTLMTAEVVSRNDAGTELQVRLETSSWNDLDMSQERRMRWVLEDAWTRPDRVTWTLGDRIVLRQRPWPMTYGFGFVNVEGPNTLTDFDGVFGLNAYLSWTDHCWRDPIYLGFYEWGYSVTLNRSPGGSCYGFVAASQSIYNHEFDPAWLNAGFIDHAVLPAGRWETGGIRENNPSCGPRSPASLWAWIQTFHGIQQCEEHLYQQLNQIVQHSGVWRGNIGARLVQLGVRPHDYMLCMKPRSGTTGHCVLPYRIEPLNDRITRVWVYDPNYPYRHYLPEDHPANVRSVYSYVDFDPVGNNYMFDLDASFDTNNVEVVRNHYHAGTTWSGEGLSTTLLPLGNRTMPGLGYGIDYLFSTVSGEARPQYSNEAGKRWGWNEDGTRVEEMDGVHPFTPFTFAGDETDQVSLLSRGSNAWSRVAIHARGTNYQFLTGGGGVLFGVRNPGATPGTVDHAEQRIAGGGPRAVRFESAQANPRIDPFVVMPASPGQTTNHVCWRWLDLNLPAGSPWVMEADPVAGNLGARNEGGSPVVARLVREQAGVSGPETTDFGTVTIPPGGAIRFTPADSEAGRALREEVDTNGDGVFERVLTLAPVAPSVGPGLAAGRVDWAKKRIRLRIREASRADVTVERSGDLLHWEAVTTEAAPDNSEEVEAPMETGASFFRVRRLR